jgi:signal transduction histidine kinase
MAEAEAVAVLREALSNCARHAHATRVEVDVRVGDQLVIRVVDNGVGLGNPKRVSGLANARARADLLGGHLETSQPPEGGTVFDWRVPLEQTSGLDIGRPAISSG